MIKHSKVRLLPMNVFSGALLGLLQGLAEFLPISSSGHLILARLIMGIQDDNAAMKMLDILLHVGTLIPVAVVFWKDWMEMLRHPIKNKTLLLLIVASVPTLVIYMLAKKLTPESINGFAVFDSGWFLGVAFLITSLLMLLTEKLGKNAPAKEGNDRVTFKHAIIMGCMQGLGLLPGVSRSGSTISGGVFSGLNRNTAAKFSFMMSAPAIAGSLLMEGKDALEEGLFSQIAWLPTIVAIIVACVCGFLAIRFMLKLISKISMGWFALYTAVLGIVILLIQIAGVSWFPAFGIPGIG